MEAVPPTDVTSVRSFLGLINFYGRFVPNLQSMLRPIHNLLLKEAKFEWTPECQTVFEQIKKILGAGPMLVHFDPNKQIVLVCDASPYGVGAVLNLVINGAEKPCQMMSCTLSPAERNYSQLHREALAIVAAVKKFHKYIFGSKVIVYTDCKALESLLSPKKDLGNVLNSRFLRWILMLQNYDLEIKFRAAKHNANADGLSRLPQKNPTNIEAEELSFACLNVFRECDAEIIDHARISLEMSLNGSYGKLVEFVKNGWPSKIPSSLKIYFKFKDSLDIQNGCIFYGDRVFVPENLRICMLEKLHEGHQGIVKTKMLVRSSIWWPGVEKDIERYVNACEICQMSGLARKQCELQSWKKAIKPMERIHLDHFMFESKGYLIIVDAFSKWIDVYPQRRMTSECVLNALKCFMSVFGIPEKIVTDNGTPFVSDLFEKFCEVNGINHVRTPPYHPQSNGLAERSVGIVKTFLKKARLESKSGKVEEKLIEFLYLSHHSPLTDGNGTPSERMFKYKIRTNFSQLQKTIRSGCIQATQSFKEKTRGRKETVSQNVKEKVEGECPSPFKPGQKVWARSQDSTKFAKAVIVSQNSALTYFIRFVHAKRHMLMHRDSIKARTELYKPSLFQNGESDDEDLDLSFRSPTRRRRSRVITRTVSGKGRRMCYRRFL